MSLPVYREGLGDESGRAIRRYRSPLDVPSEVGFLEYRYAPGYCCELINFHVVEQHRSKGCGTDMMRDLELQARKDGMKTLYGFTSVNNLRARKLYKRLGFRLIHIPDYYGEEMDAMMVLKRL